MLSPADGTTFRTKIYDSTNKPAQPQFGTPVQLSSLAQQPQPDPAKFTVEEQVLTEVQASNSPQLLGTPERLDPMQQA